MAGMSWRDHLPRGGMFGGIPNENKSTPFFKCYTDDERRRWFQTTRPWHLLKPTAVEAMIEAFSGQRLLFEAFVLTSADRVLVNEYARIDYENDAGGRKVARAIMANALVRAAQPVADQLPTLIKSRTERSREQFVSGMRFLIHDCLNIAIVLNEEEIGAYMGLIGAHALMMKIPEAKSYASKALAISEKLEENEHICQLSSIPEIRDFNETTPELKSYLLSLLTLLTFRFRLYMSSERLSCAIAGS